MWKLIAVIISGATNGISPATIATDFVSEQQCTAAMNDIANKVQAISLPVSNENKTVVFANCYKTGN